MSHKCSILLTLLLLISLSNGYADERKKVGLVLSGGGAKGLAHIGVIEVLEDAGIPIDYVVGTSMGAIVGGLYAIGYSGRELDTVVRRQDWNFLLGDKVKRDYLSFMEKEATERYVLSFSLGRDRGNRVPAGFVAGQNVGNLFKDLTIGYHDSLDFSRFPTPFACVAANIVDGSEVVLDRGSLAQAMRASMAIPGFFTPVHLDSLVLVDGGIVNNYPVDVAKRMGADIIIGVNVQADLRTSDKLNAFQGVMGQLVNLLCLNKFDENYAQTDLYIKPDINEFSAASFTPQAVDTLIVRGRRAAEAKRGELEALRRRIGVGEKNGRRQLVARRDTFFIRAVNLKGVSDDDARRLHRTIRIRENTAVTMDEIRHCITSLYGTRSFTGVTYSLTGGPEEYVLEIQLTERRANMVNLGFRFDSEEMAAILLNTRLNHKAFGGSKLSLTARLSKSPFVRLDYAFENPFLRRLNVAYEFKYNDFNLYYEGDKASGITYRYHLGEVALSDIYLRNFQFQVGLRYEYFDYDPFLYKEGSQAGRVISKGYVSYFALARIETYDRKYYPRKGLSFAASYALHTDDFVQMDEGVPISAIGVGLEGVVRVTNRFSLLPSLAGRVLVGKNVPFPFLNYMGGQAAGRYMPQQLSFEGISHVETFDKSLVTARLRLRQRMGGRHYVFATANVALHENDFFDILKGQVVWGGSVSYSYDSAVGPIDVTLSLSDRTDKVGMYFNLGYYF